MQENPENYERIRNNETFSKQVWTVDGKLFGGISLSSFVQPDRPALGLVT